MKQNPDILDDYNVYPVEKSKIYILVLFFFAVYFLFFTAELFFSFDTLRFKREHVDWQTILIILVIPIIGFLLLIAKKKAGWFISTLYFAFLAVAAISTTIVDKIKFSDDPLTVKQWSILLLSNILSILLLTKSIRTLFNIKFWLCITTIRIAACLAFMLVYWG